MLANPDMSKPVNTEASEMIMRSPHTYRQMVLDCVVASQRVEDQYQSIDPAKYSQCLYFSYPHQTKFKSGRNHSVGWLVSCRMVGLLNLLCPHTMVQVCEVNYLHISHVIPKQTCDMCHLDEV